MSEEFKGVKFIREDVKSTESQVVVVKGEAIVDEYKKINANGYTVSSILLCEDGTIIFYIEEGN